MHQLPRQISLLGSATLPDGTGTPEPAIYWLATSPMSESQAIRNEPSGQYSRLVAEYDFVANPFRAQSVDI